MSYKKFFKMAIEAVEEMKEKEEGEVFIVWYCKTLQNWKAILGTAGALYEATVNGDKGEMYIDRYEKTENRVFR